MSVTVTVTVTVTATVTVTMTMTMTMTMTITFTFTFTFTVPATATATAAITVRSIHPDEPACLMRPQPCVQTLVRKQLGVGPAFGNAAVFKDNQAVHPRNG